MTIWRLLVALALDTRLLNSCSTLLCCLCAPFACMPLFLQQILVPQILGWLGMWVGSLVVSNAISTKTHMRNVLAAAGRVWTRQEEAARLLLAAELEDTQEQVAAMSDDALANLALKLMMVGGAAAWSAAGASVRLLRKHQGHTQAACMCLNGQSMFCVKEQAWCTGGCAPTQLPASKLPVPVQLPWGVTWSVWAPTRRARRAPRSS